MKLTYQAPEANITYFNDVVRLNDVSDNGEVVLPDDEL